MTKQVSEPETKEWTERDESGKVLPTCGDSDVPTGGVRVQTLGEETRVE